jgi:hypothetical protein
MNKILFCTWLSHHSLAVAGNITTQPKQGRQAGLMSRLCILLCLWESSTVEEIVNGVDMAAWQEDSW